MSSISLSDLKFIKPTILAEILKAPETASKIAIIDVRDDDHVGGHIKGSQWVPIHQLDARLPELLRVNAAKDKVVFHCMLSQQRGPKAALMYARAKQREVDRVRREHAEKEQVDAANDGEWEDVDQKDGKIGGQEVCVLEGGFGAWQAFHGDDETLTENYAKDLWT